MNPDELTPLAKRDDDPFETALLRAAKRERAPEGAERRVLAVLGVAGAAGTTGAAGAFLSKYASRIGLKGAFVVVAIGASVAGVSHWATSDRASVEEPSPGAVPNATPPPVTTPEEARVESVPSTRVEDLPTSQAPATKAPSAAPPVQASPQAAKDDAPGGLAREVALVEEARAALARGDAAASLRALDAYDREFASGTLAPEARVLRIEVLVRAGSAQDIARANRLGDAFLAEHPSGPHARRVRAVLDRSR